MEDKKHPILDDKLLSNIETPQFWMATDNIMFQYWKTKKHSVLDDYCINSSLYREISDNHPKTI